MFISCNGPELGAAPTADKCTDSVPDSSTLHSASSECRAPGNASAHTGHQCTCYWCSGGSSPGELCHHNGLSAEHICGCTSDSRIVHQPCHRKSSRTCFSRHVTFHSLQLVCERLLHFPVSDVGIFTAQINAASLGAQPQFLSSLTSTPIISSAISSMAGITSQIITNAQGQVRVNKYR